MERNTTSTPPPPALPPPPPAFSDEDDDDEAAEAAGVGVVYDAREVACSCALRAFWKSATCWDEAER
jgi:hypothetical protein